MWRGPLPHVSVTVVVTSARPSCASTTPRCRAGAHSTRRAWLQRTPAPRRAPPTRSTRSHTVPSRRCARFPADHAARPADQVAGEHARRRARPVVHRHPRQPPHWGVDSRGVSAAGSSPGTTPPPCHATLPLSSRTRFVPITTRHSTISPGSPSDRCAAPAGHAGHQHRDRAPLDRPCPATDQIAISAITLARTVHTKVRGNDRRTPTTSLPSARAVRPGSEPKTNSTRRHSTLKQHPHPRPRHGRGHRHTPTATTTGREHDHRSHSHRRAATPFTTNTDDLAGRRHHALTRSPP
jgi:hypothetical protein